MVFLHMQSQRLMDWHPDIVGGLINLSLSFESAFHLNLSCLFIDKNYYDIIAAYNLSVLHIVILACNEARSYICL